MNGLPYETDEDIKGIAALAKSVIASITEQIRAAAKAPAAGNSQRRLLYSEAVYAFPVGTAGTLRRNLRKAERRSCRR